MKLGTIDPGRLEKAIHLVARKVGDGQYMVVHPPPDELLQEHYVDLVAEDIPRCDCGDHLWRDSVCKHILAALLTEGHPVAAAALAGYFANKRSHK